MKVYLNKIKHKLWESYLYNPPLNYSKIRLFASSEHSFNRINNNNKKKIIEFEQILLMTGNSFDYEFMLNKRKWLIERLTKSDIKFLISPTEIAKTNALYYLENNKIISDKIKVVRPSVNLARFRERKKKKSNLGNKINLLFIGQRFYGKGGPICFEIANRLNHMKMNFHFKFVSRDVPKSYRIPKNVEIIDYEISENLKYDLYDWSHFFIFPVVQDSFGVYLECLETCTPIISTNIYDKADIIENNKTGIMIETPFQLYEYKNFGLKWKNWNQFNNYFVDHFNNGIFEDMISKYVKILENFINNPQCYHDMTNNIANDSIERFHPNIRNNSLVSIYKNMYHL